MLRRSLVSQHNLGWNAGMERVLFGGCSAGARGAMANLDYVAEMLPAGVELMGLLDSPLWIDVEPISSQIVSLQQETQAVYALVDPSGRIPPACATAYAGEEWKCIFAQYRMPFLQTPYFLNAGQVQPAGPPQDFFPAP